MLAIETSCDETAAAVVDRDFRLLSNIVHSQVEHEAFGGVVPEVAARRHLELLPGIVRKALDSANVEPRSVAVTIGPGLIGSLLVGVGFAKAYALSKGIPVFGIHHISGHLHAILLEDPQWSPPFLALTVSGGHTELVMVEAPGAYRSIARTRDDAAGEAFDKAAKMLGLGIPGGPKLSKLAESAGSERIRLSGALMSDQADFSFSGLKTALRRNLHQDKAVLAASFEDAIVESLCQKTDKALAGVSKLVLTGGVAANQKLRKAMKAVADDNRVRFAVPSAELCTDNAAMIGAAALAYPREPLDPAASPRALLELF